MSEGLSAEQLPVQDTLYKKDQVISLINSVLAKVEANSEVSSDSIQQELADLQKIIREARSDIGAARPSDIKEKHIPTATDELDAVVESTAEATGTIMDCCDVIQEKAGEIEGEISQAISDEVIKIYEACSFQDLTGQRITKVVNTLKTIEDKVERMIAVLSDGVPGVDHYAGEEEQKGDGLLNGPQLPGKGVSQDDIDALLAELDG